MTAKWETFESECTDFLNNNYGKFAKFIHKGGHNSTIPDIQVETTSGKTFYMEAKHCPAQCGQFVLLPNITSKTFEYSSLNMASTNRYTPT